MATNDATQSAGSTQPKGSVTDTDTSPFEAYDEKVAAADVSRYRKNGPRPWTRTLIEAIKVEGVEGATLLDIGGGIGVIQHELLDSGAARATSVEASSAYLSAARSESDQRGLVDRVTYHHGDFVDLAESIQPADVVTLDRVLNVYPDWERLASLSAERARRLYGVVIPRTRASSGWPSLRSTWSCYFADSGSALRSFRSRSSTGSSAREVSVGPSPRRSGLPGRSCSTAATDERCSIGN